MEDPADGSPATSVERGSTRRVHGRALLIGFCLAPRAPAQSRVDIARLFLRLATTRRQEKKDGSERRKRFRERRTEKQQRLQKGSRSIVLHRRTFFHACCSC